MYSGVPVADRGFNSGVERNLESPRSESYTNTRLVYAYLHDLAVLAVCSQKDVERLNVAVN